jgi:hypothetical protein
VARPSESHVSWHQATAFRLLRHHLSERAPGEELLPVLREMGGAQSQVLSAAQISVAARTESVRMDDLESAVWEERSLTKAWCMRRTLYLLPSRDVATFVRGSAGRAEREWLWMRNRGVSERQLECLIQAVFEELDEPRTRTEMTARVSRSLGLPLRREQGGGWGSRREVTCVRVGEVTCPSGYLLHLAGARGVICSGPNRGTETTFVRADQWLPRWRDVARDSAETELLRIYLHAFGPAAPEDFAWWTGLRLTDVRAIWKRAEDEFAPVVVEGWPAWVLKRDLPQLEKTATDSSTVRLLPFFDAFLLGHRERAHLVDAKHHHRVYRAQGWVAPAVIVDGRALGVWSHRSTPDRLRVRVELFAPVSRATRTAVRAEAEELGRFLGLSHVETQFG